MIENYYVLWAAPQASPTFRWLRQLPMQVLNRRALHPRTGIIAGSGGASSASQVAAAEILQKRGIKRVGPYRVTQTMGSTVSACLATAFKIKGINYSISSACSTSAHCIGNAMEQIQLGKQDIVFAGGGEEEHWTMSCLFDAMGALSSKYNDTPELASRAYDRIETVCYRRRRWHASVGRAGTRKSPRCENLR